MSAQRLTPLEPGHMTVLQSHEGRLTRITLARPPLNILDIASLPR